MCEICDQTIWRDTVLDLAFLAGQQVNTVGRKIIEALLETAPTLSAEIRSAAIGGQEKHEIMVIDRVAEQLRSLAPLTRAQAARALIWWANHAASIMVRERASRWLDAARSDDQAVVRAAAVLVIPRRPAMPEMALVGA